MMSGVLLRPVNILLCKYTFLSSVRGYLPAPADSQRNMMDLNVEQETLRELSSRKQNLLLELKNYEANAAASLGGGGLARGGAAGRGGKYFIDKYFYGVFSQLFSAGEVDMGMIPAQTQLQTALAINLGTEGRAVRRSEHHCLLSTHLHFPRHYSVFALYYTSLCSRVSFVLLLFGVPSVYSGLLRLRRGEINENN